MKGWCFHLTFQQQRKMDIQELKPKEVQIKKSKLTRIISFFLELLL